MAVIRTARERAREELTQEIKREARRQVAVAGAQQLSLRAVARELGMVSSALYRYYPSRDDLLTALIVDAYTDLAEVVERALAGGSAGAARGGSTAGAGPTRAERAQGARERWRALCGAVRDWAVEHPHEYALIYGTPVPGYHAPEETVALATRVPLALVDVIRGAAGHLDGAPGRPASPVLATQLTELAARHAPELSQAVLVRAVIAWTQLFGMISFELFGRLAGSVDPADEFFAQAVEEMADLIGLPETPVG
ncbi:TetR/AcrR family transcriptional regulator [Kitasatospora sp. NPDC052896]|uniref:TetR/AcrR family transcriptional regulator n=1 Tax=Kitasatospora sp. NPDC052896 TaxID=3364061 RepID=UPI0037C56914